MAIKTENRIIGGNEFEVRQLGFAAQRAVFVRLLNVAGPTLVAMFKELMSTASKAKTKGEAVDTFTKALGDLDVSKLADAATDFFARLDDKELEYLTKMFGDQSRIRPEGANGFIPLNADSRELLFAGDAFLDYFKWLAFSLEVNYRGFFSGSSGAGEIARALRKAEA